MNGLFYYVLQYNGLNFTNFINFLLKNNISVFNIKKEGLRRVEFTIDYFNYNKLKKINPSYDILIIKSGGIKHLFKNLLKRVGIIVGCVAVFFSSFLFNKFSSTIKVVGNTIHTEKITEKINNYCSENGSQFETANLEKYLLENILELSLVSVKKQGNLIIVNAMDKHIIVDEYEPLCAPYNMLINDIKLISGTLLVGGNDIVKKGDVIVDSYTISSNGERTLVPAKADIIASVWFCGSEIAMKQNIKYEKTGNKKVYSSMYFKNIVYKEQMSPYEHFMTETKIVNVTNNYFLPLYLVKNIFYETKKNVNIFDFEKEKQICLEKSKQKAYTNLPKNVIIEETKQNVSELSDRYIFQTYLKTTMEINYEN